ncbi:glycine betaine ABC transporter substrate-binding protein [Rhizosaccharibacter radicis]|uniref:Glycine betaine ABC transporter substrate-binding protein n=1 Tax=Rhizosaccharibacter radicis TaxID=2782605 RepID=A0ABT1W1E0_9PROT|nr:glycine betaine ABC transporter substrate-binding protein [Acetobacteraceae bacterium KSS12]
MTLSTLLLAHPDEPRHEAAAAAVLRVLEAHEMEVEMFAAPRAVLERRMREGGIDMLATAWLPDRDAEWTTAAFGMGAMGGVLYRPHALWAATTAVPPAIATLEDLGRPETAAILERSLLVPASLETLCREVVGTYGLAEAGFALEVLPEENAVLRATALLDAGVAAVVPCWQPGALLHGGRLRPLADPRGVLGRPQEARLLLREGLRAELDPDLLDELDELTLGNPVISAMENAMRRDGMSADDAAEAWQRGKLTPRT